MLPGSNPAELLGLPEPDDAPEEIADAYGAFLATITVGELTLTCDPEFFSGIFDDGSFSAPRLRLLAALVRPSRDQLARIRRRVLPSRGSFDWNRGRPSSGRKDPLVAQAFSIFTEYASSPEATAFQARRDRRQILGRMRRQLLAPGGRRDDPRRRGPPSASLPEPTQAADGTCRPLSAFRFQKVS